MESNVTHSRRIFLCLAAITAATVEFGGLSNYAPDHVAIVMYSYRWHIGLAQSKANDNEPGEQLAVSTETVTSVMSGAFVDGGLSGSLLVGRATGPERFNQIINRLRTSLKGE